MVDIVVHPLGVSQVDDAPDNAYQVFLCEEPHLLGNLQAELAVHLVPAHAAEIVPARIEKERVDVFPGIFYPGGLIGTELPEQFHHGLISIERSVFFKGGCNGDINIPDPHFRPAHAPELLEMFLGDGPVPGQHSHAVLIKDGLS